MIEVGDRVRFKTREELLATKLVYLAKDFDGTDSFRYPNAESVVDQMFPLFGKHAVVKKVTPSENGDNPEIELFMCEDEDLLDWGWIFQEYMFVKVEEGDSNTATNASIEDGLLAKCAVISAIYRDPEPVRYALVKYPRWKQCCLQVLPYRVTGVKIQNDNGAVRRDPIVCYEEAPSKQFTVIKDGFTTRESAIEYRNQYVKEQKANRFDFGEQLKIEF